MDTLQQDVEDRLDHFTDVCKANGIKLTHQRLEIFRKVAETEDHPDAEQIFQRVRKNVPTVSLDTVYRTLWLLRDLGLVATLGVPHERTRFDANLAKHHHFFCTCCGFTRDFYSDDLNNLSLPESVGQFGSITTTQVEVRGICKECSGKKDNS